MLNLPEKWRASGVVILSVLWTSYTLLYLFKVFFYFGIVVFPPTHRAITIGLLFYVIMSFYVSSKADGLKSTLEDITSVESASGAATAVSLYLNESSSNA